MLPIRSTFQKLAVLISISIPSVAPAAIFDLPDAGGYGSFRDENTGRIWLDLDTYFGQTYADMVSQANTLGFTIATSADVHELLDTLPLTSGQWASYADIMGSAPARPLIWGGFDAGGGSVHNWAFAFSGDSQWNFFSNAGFNTEIFNEGSPFADLNVWAYQEARSVPETASTLLLLTFSSLILAAASRARARV